MPKKAYKQSINLFYKVKAKKHRKYFFTIKWSLNYALIHLMQKFLNLRVNSQ